MTPSVEADESLIEHILECIKYIQEYTEGGSDVFFEDAKTQDAVIRRLQTLAESSITLSDEAKSLVENIPWEKIRGFRNIVVHEYLAIELPLVWATVSQDLPLLLEAMHRMKELRQNLPER